MTKTLRLAVLCAFLCGCSTVRGWIGWPPADDVATGAAAKPVAAAAVAKPVTAAAVAKDVGKPESKDDAKDDAPAPRGGARDDLSSRDRRTRAEDDIRRELKSVADDAKAGRIGVKEAKNRLKRLGEELEVAVAAEGATAVGERDLGGLADRLDALDRKLDEVLRRLVRLEQQVDAIGR